MWLCLLMINKLCYRYKYWVCDCVEQTIVINTVPVGTKGDSGITLTDNNYMPLLSKETKYTNYIELPGGRNNTVFLKDSGGLSTQFPVGDKERKESIQTGPAWRSEQNCFLANTPYFVSANQTHHTL